MGSAPTYTDLPHTLVTIFFPLYILLPLFSYLLFYIVDLAFGTRHGELAELLTARKA